MDIFQKLRLLFWTLVLILWGMFMYQFIFDDTGKLVSAPVIKKLRALLPKKFAKKESKVLGYVAPTEAELEAIRKQSYAQKYGTTPPAAQPGAPQPPAPPTVPQAQPQPDQPPADPYTVTATQQAAPPAPRQIASLPKTGSAASLTETHTTQERAAYPAASKKKIVWPAPPPGYDVRDTRHFLIYIQPGAATPPDELVETVEELRGRLMTNLLVFAPILRDERVLLYVFADRDGYTAITGRPAWSGGASSLKERSIYVLEGSDALGVLAHELTHIYFDSFFDRGVQCPLWLSEGMALMSQTELGQNPPQWLTATLQNICDGIRLPLSELIACETCSGMPQDTVQTWYSQSYSLGRYMKDEINQTDNFYNFCKNLRDGLPFNQSLYRAYGMPFNTLKHLEYAWESSLPRLQRAINAYARMKTTNQRGVPRLRSVNSLVPVTGATTMRQPTPQSGVNSGAIQKLSTAAAQHQQNQTPQIPRLQNILNIFSPNAPAEKPKQDQQAPQQGEPAPAN